MFRVTMNNNKKNLNILSTFRDSEPVMYLLNDEMKRAENWRKLSKKSCCKEEKRRLYVRAMNSATDVQRMISTAIWFYRSKHDRH